MMKILKNAIRCNLCGDEIESKYRHDYVRCSCGACAVDGGHDYLHRTYKNKDLFTELAVVADLSRMPDELQSEDDAKCGRV